MGDNRNLSADGNASPRAAAPGEPLPARETEQAAGSLLEVLLRSAEGATDPTSARAVTGHLQGTDSEGRLLFRPEGSSGAPLPVVIGVEIPDGTLVRAARQQRRALVVRTADATPRWVLVGLVRERVAARARDASPGQLEVTLDGETLRLTAERQIELRCGKASLLLQSDGRVVLSGTYVVSTSRGPNKIKGATIALN